MQVQRTQDVERQLRLREEVTPEVYWERLWQARENGNKIRIEHLYYHRCYIVTMTAWWDKFEITIVLYCVSKEVRHFVVRDVLFRLHAGLLELPNKLGACSGEFFF